MAKFGLAAVFVLFTIGFSLFAPAAFATSSPLVCTTSSNNAASTDGSMGVKATAGTCPNGTNNAWAGYDAFKGGVYQVTGTQAVGTACGQNVYVTNAQDYWFGEADYGSGCVPGGKYNFAFNTSLSYQWPGGSGGFGVGGVTVIGWSGNCQSTGSGSACIAEATAS